MKVNYLTLLAGATLVLLSAAATRAEESAASALAADANAAPPALATTASTAPVARGVPRGRHRHLLPRLRSGAGFHCPRRVWAVHSSGSPTEIGQYQNVGSPRPSSNLDGIKSDGNRTFDFGLQGSDNDTDDARLHYFGPRVEANLDYQRFDHQLTRIPMRAGRPSHCRDTAAPAGPPINVSAATT